MRHKVESDRVNDCNSMSNEEYCQMHLEDGRTKDNSMPSKKIVVSIIGIIVIAVIGWLVAPVKPSLSPLASPDELAPLPVTASFYPLAEFVKHVGQEKVTVTNLTPTGAEPHDFDPSPQDIIHLQNSRLFIYNGVGLESWVDRVLPDLQSRAVILVKASTGIEVLPADPHIWLDPALSVAEVETIKNGFIQADPANKNFYQANAAHYQQQLQQLDQEFSQGLAHCESKDIISSHAALGYIARHYGLNMVPIAGLSPDEEPSPQRLAEIARFAKQHNVHYIFFETLVSPRLAQTIANEVGAQTIVFNPLEGLTGEELAQGKDYISVQKENLANLKIALACQ